MKKLLIVISALVLTTSFSYAQGARNASDQTVTHQRSNFSNVGVTGLDTLGNPGYLVLTPITKSSVDFLTEWYIWVDETGDLCMASHPTIATYASFPNGNWNPTNMPVCTKVGGQS